jgi:hypothetical protein
MRSELPAETSEHGASSFRKAGGGRGAGGGGGGAGGASPSGGGYGSSSRYSSHQQGLGKGGSSAASGLPLDEDEDPLTEQPAAPRLAADMSKYETLIWGTDVNTADTMKAIEFFLRNFRLHDEVLAVSAGVKERERACAPGRLPTSGSPPPPHPTPTPTTPHSSAP